MLITPGNISAGIGSQLLCGIGAGAMGFALLHLAYPGYVGDYYQARQYANYFCVWQSPAREILASLSVPFAIWAGITMTALSAQLQRTVTKHAMQSRCVPLFVLATGFSATAVFASCQLIYDMRAWRVDPHQL
jgi:hypothetical protein